MSPQHTSVWAATAQLPAYSPLTTDTAADVCIVGAGISGLTTAYLLTQVGQSVVVLDDGAIGSGMTGVTTAHLTNAIDDRYFDIERLHGEQRRPAGRRKPHRRHRPHREHRDARAHRVRLHAPRWLPVLRARARRGLPRSRARGRAPRRPPERRENRARAAGVRYRRLSPVPEPGAVSPAQVPGRSSRKRSSAPAGASMRARTRRRSAAATTPPSRPMAAR